MFADDGARWGLASRVLGLLAFLACAVPARCRAQAPPGRDPRDLSGLICWWDFQEPGGTPRRSRGPRPYALEERNGPIERADDGVWGPHSARIKMGQWFRAARGSCPALDLHGPRARYTILAWVKRMTDNRWQFVAGMWDEKDARRQYAMFISGSLMTSWRTLRREPADHRAHAYASAEGGGTPPSRICLSYATGATRLDKDRWYFLAASYDGEQLRAYVDGELDALDDHNPYRYHGKPIFDGGPAGADFTVGQRAVPSWPEYPEGRYGGGSAKTGPLGFDGLIGGLGVFSRALDDAEIRGVHKFLQEAGPQRRTRRQTARSAPDQPEP